MQVDFYHLGGIALARVIARIAERVVEQGGRLLVVTGDETAAELLDRELWTYSDESFLPHGRAGQEGEAMQPVLIGTSPASANGARNIAIADGLWRDEALGFDRAFHFFDDLTVAAARRAWKLLGTRDGIERNFWKQDDRGRWSKVASG